MPLQERSLALFPVASLSSVPAGISHRGREERGTAAWKMSYERDAEAVTALQLPGGGTGKYGNFEQIPGI